MNKHANKGLFCSKAAFTLIELLVVVLIIGILAAVALPQYKKAVLKSRIVQIETNFHTLAKAAQVCALERGRTCTLDELDVEIAPFSPIPEISETGEYKIYDGSVALLKSEQNPLFKYYWQTGFRNCGADMPIHTLICYGDNVCPKAGFPNKIPNSCADYVRY